MTGSQKNYWTFPLKNCKLCHVKNHLALVIITERPIHAEKKTHVMGTTGIKVNVGLQWVSGYNSSAGLAYRLNKKLLSFRIKFDDGDYPHLVVP